MSLVKAFDRRFSTGMTNDILTALPLPIDLEFKLGMLESYSIITKKYGK